MKGSTDERLLDRLLRQVDVASQTESEPESLSTTNHTDDETMAMFVDGSLDDDQRDRVITHLADCVSCRNLASRLLSIPSDEEKEDNTVNPTTETQWTRFVGPLLAVAAGLLMVVGLSKMWMENDSELLAQAAVYNEASGLLKQGEYNRVRQVIAEGKKEGITSGSLVNLDVQAQRGIPSPQAITSAGRLSDFGYGIGGVVAMGPETSSSDVDLRTLLSTLAEFGSDDETATLNRGHLLLELGETDKAISVFDKVILSNERQPLAWLGRGIARYIRQDYSGAAEDFRQALQQDFRLTDAKINLAMSLEEMDRLQSAIELWGEVLAESIEEPEKVRIRVHVDKLQSFLKN